MSLHVLSSMWTFLLTCWLCPGLSSPLEKPVLLHSPFLLFYLPFFYLKKKRKRRSSWSIDKSHGQSGTPDPIFPACSGRICIHTGRAPALALNTRIQALLLPLLQCRTQPSPTFSDTKTYGELRMGSPGSTSWSAMTTKSAITQLPSENPHSHRNVSGHLEPGSMYIHTHRTRHRKTDRHTHTHRQTHTNIHILLPCQLWFSIHPLRQGRDQAEGCHLLPGHRGSLLWPLTVRFQGEAPACCHLVCFVSRKTTYSPLTSLPPRPVSMKRPFHYKDQKWNVRPWPHPLLLLKS